MSATLPTANVSATLPTANVSAAACRTQHTLPVTGLAVGAGEASPRVVTCSRDQTCRVWSTASGDCLQTVLLPAPLTSTALHWTEHGCFLGAADSKIYHVALPPADGHDADAPVALSMTSRAVITPMTGHTQAVTCLALDLDDALLVSGAYSYLRTLRTYSACLDCSAPSALSVLCQHFEWMLRPLLTSWADT